MLMTRNIISKSYSTKSFDRKGKTKSRYQNHRMGTKTYNQKIAGTKRRGLEEREKKVEAIKKL